MFELTNEIIFERPGYTVKTWQDNQGNVYFQEIICGCINRTRKSTMWPGDFYDMLHNKGLTVKEN